MTNSFRRTLPGALALCVAALLSACQSAQLVPKIPGLEPYRMTIQQGNYLSQEMVAQLKFGMTREQVRFVLGTPLLMDVFHADRWDYVYTREVLGGKKEQRNLSVMFEKDKLVRVFGDLLPPEGTAAQPTGFVPQTKPNVPAMPAQPAAAETKPAAEAPKAAAEAPKPAAETVETTQNWGTAAPEPEKQPAPVAGDEVKKPEAKTADDSTQKPAAEAEEPGFFGRLRQKIGL